MRRRLRDGEAVVKRAKSVTLDSTYIARLAGEKRESVTAQPEEGVRFYESKRAKKTEERSERRPEIDVGTVRVAMRTRAAGDAAEARGAGEGATVPAGGGVWAMEESGKAGEEW